MCSVTSQGAPQGKRPAVGGPPGTWLVATGSDGSAPSSKPHAGSPAVVTVQALAPPKQTLSMPAWKQQQEDNWNQVDWINTPKAINAYIDPAPLLIVNSPFMCPPGANLPTKQTMDSEEVVDRVAARLLEELTAGHADPADGPESASHGKPIGMLEQLQALQDEDPGTVLIARRLHRLGFGSQQKLEAYFGQFGSVKQVLVPHSRVKQVPGRRTRARPASIGFIVMSELADAAAVLSCGEVHSICGDPINVKAFEKRAHGSSSKELDEDQGDLFDVSEKQQPVTPEDPTASTPPTSASSKGDSSDVDGESIGESTPESHKGLRWSDISEDADVTQGLRFKGLRLVSK